MRIIGGRDYYDSALAVAGRDDDIVLVRNEPIQIPERQLGLFGPLDFSKWHPHKSGSLTKIHLIVAGKLYPCVRAIVNKDVGTETHHFYSKDSLVEFVRERMADWSKSVEYEDAYKSDFFAESLSTQDVDKLIRNRVVTAVLDPERTIDPKTRQEFWHVNGDLLKNYQLVKVLDPFTCFQEISMWVGGTIPRNPNPMVEIKDDKIKAAKHGFDKFSFRKGKQK